jgi:lipid II:glycine glycyltransferase (peptidoglycan interpeptide bridge formation enzyme)
MTLTISRVQPASSKEWDEIWLHCPYSTYFQSREWAEIWRLYTNNQQKPAPQQIDFSDNSQVIMPFSVFKRNKGLTRCYLSSPAGTYGGWLSTNSLQETHVKLLMDLIERKWKNLTWRLNPYDEVTIRSCSPQAKPDDTERLNLQIGFEQIMKNLSQGHRSAVNKALRSGIIVRTAQNLSEWESYFEIYQSSLQRWGERATSNYRWELFRHIYDMHSNWSKLWLACFNEKIIGGALCFYSPRIVIYWHGAALEAFFQHRPSNLLFVEIIRDACQNHLVWFDFNPSGGHSGVLEFKRRFGTHTAPSPVISTVSRTTRFFDFWLLQLRVRSMLH